ncbi:MAG: hypothetical protein J1F35_05055 [Erysipelotrichales bacterium]|nr:hypothetical protein [Erysipelotrichales bacterium]
MRCISCNNEIPDGTTVCPYCNSNVTPVTPSVPVNNNNMVDTSVLPTVPTTPVLPQDQNLNMAEQVNDTIVDTVEENNESTQVQPAAEVNVVVEPEVEPMPEPEPEVQITPEQNDGNMANLNSEPQEFAVDNVVPTEATPLENAINPEFIEPSGDSVKLGNTKATENKKNKKSMIILIVVVAVVLLIAILGGVFYYTQFKTANKRIEKIVSAITSGTSSLNNEVIDKSSGSYNLDLSVSYADTNIGGKVNGTYAKDLSGRALDLTFNLESLNMGEELVASPINVELYYADSKVYVLLQNFYENYIYEEYPEFDSLFNAIEQNNINYVVLVNGVKNAFSNGLQNMSSTQSIGNATINGQTKRANIITINYNEVNTKRFLSAFFRNLSNNQTFIAELAKLTETSEEDVKTKLQEAAVEEYEFDETQNATLEIYTAMFGNEMYGLKISSKNDNETDVLEVYPVVNGYGISYKEGSQNVIDGTVLTTSKSTSTTSENTYTVDFTIYVDGQAYKVHFNLETIRDVNPKDAKVNVKNSINKKYMPEEDKQAILANASQSGNIGLYLPSILYTLLYDATEIETPIVDNPDIGEVTPVDPCTQAINCVSSVDGTYQNCQNPETFEAITCPIAQ